MVDVAELVAQARSDGVDRVAVELKELSTAARGAETSVQNFGQGTRSVTPHMRNMERALEAQTRQMKAMQQAGLNMGRQVTDVFVQMGSGASIFMVALQQGPQIFDGLQVAAMQTGKTVTGVMVAMGAAVWTALAPLIPVMLAIAAAAGTIAAGWALATRSITRDVGDVTASLDLNERQLERLREANVQTTATAGDAWRGLGKTINDMLQESFGAQLAWAGRQWNSFLDGATSFAGAAVDFIAGTFLAGYRVVVHTWSLLPAAIGDAALSAAGLAVNAVEAIINAAVDGLNSLNSQMRGMAAANPQMFGLLAAIPQLGRVSLGVNNPYAGSMNRLDGGNLDAIQSSFADTRGMSGRFMSRWRANTQGVTEGRVLEAAGDAGRAATGGGAGSQSAGQAVEQTRQLVENLREMERIDLQPLTAQQELQLGLLTAIAQETDRIDGLTRRAAYGFAEAWGRAGEALAGITTALSGYRAEVAAINLEQKKGELTAEQATRDRASAQIQSYGDMASAAKSFFGEQTAAYRALQGVEMAYRALQFANAVKAMALDSAETGSSVANSLARGAAKAAEAVAGIFAKLGPFGFPVAAAAIAVMASVGLKALGGGGSSAAPVMPTTNEGTGTVLGDAGAASASIGNSLDRAERYWNRDLDLSNKMVSALRAIQSDIGTVADSIARQLGVGGALSTAGLGLGTTTQNGFFGSTTRTSSLAGRGLDLNGGMLGDLIAGGVGGSLYTLIENSKTKSGFLGFGGGTTTWLTENRTGIDSALGQELGRVLASLRAGVLTAATTLGIQGAEATLDSLNIALGRIDFEGLSSSEITERLNAVFSAAGDQMAAVILPGLSAYQKAGEGMMETLTRLATTFTTVDTTLRSLGMTFNAVGLESLAARDRLVELSGGLEQFTDQATFFAENFLTEAERIAPIQATVAAELQRLGIATDISRSQFAALVRGLDVSTESGAATYAALMNLAPALDRVLTYTDDLAESAANAARELAEAAAEAAQSAVDAARNDLTQAYEREAGALRDTESRFLSFARSLSEFRRSLEIDNGIGGIGYGAARSRFNEVAALAALGNEEALGELQGVSQQYLEASKAYSKDSLAYLKDLSAVKVALQRAEGTATRTATNAQMQLAALDASVAGLITLNTSVLSVRDAITRLQEALTNQRAVTAAASMGANGVTIPSWAREEATPGRDFGANPAFNMGLANLTGYTGSFADPMAFENWLATQGEYQRMAARSWYRSFDMAPGFATGGSFTVGGSGGPDSQLMPLRLTPGEMVNVRRPGDRDEEMEALRAEIAALRREMGPALVAIATNTGKTARQLDRWDGDGLPEERSVAA